MSPSILFNRSFFTFRAFNEKWMFHLCYIRSQNLLPYRTAVLCCSGLSNKLRQLLIILVSPDDLKRMSEPRSEKITSNLRNEALILKLKVLSTLCVLN